MGRALLLCAALWAGSAAAGTCPAPAGASEKLAHTDSLVRWGHVQGWLLRDSGRARLWNFAWVGVNAALAVGQGVAAPFISMPDRVDWVVGAIGTAASALGYVLFALDVPDPVSAADGESCASLAEAERRMKVGHDSEAFGVSIWSHALAIGLAAVPALVLGIFYKRWESAALLFAGGVVLDEAAVLTTPTGLRDAYRAYLDGSFVGGSEPAAHASLGVFPLLRDGRALGAGLAVSGVF